MLSPWHDTLSVATNDKLYWDLLEPEGDIEGAIKFANDMKACISSDIRQKIFDYMAIKPMVIRFVHKACDNPIMQGDEDSEDSEEQEGQDPGTIYKRNITMTLTNSYVPVRLVRTALAEWLEWPVEELELIVELNSTWELYQGPNKPSMRYKMFGLLDCYTLHDYHITRSTHMGFARHHVSVNHSTGWQG